MTAADQRSTWPHPIPSGYSRLNRGRMAADEFTQVANRLFRDERLSHKAKGIFGHMSTHRDGYGVSAKSLAEKSTDGVTAVMAGLKELEKYGYLVRTRLRKPDGTWGETVFNYTDQPQEMEPENG